MKYQKLIANNETHIWTTEPTLTNNLKKNYYQKGGYIIIKITKNMQNISKWIPLQKLKFIYKNKKSTKEKSRNELWKLDIKNIMGKKKNLTMNFRGI